MSEPYRRSGVPAKNWTARRAGVAGLNVVHFAVPELVSPRSRQRAARWLVDGTKVAITWPELVWGVRELRSLSRWLCERFEGDDGAPYLLAVAVGTGFVIFGISGGVVVRRGQERCVVALAARGVGHPRLIVGAGTEALALAIRIRTRRLRARRAGIRAGHGRRLG